MESKDQASLRRSVTPWGSYSWGYADVGADIFVALGLVFGAAAGASNVAFLFAGFVYICVGLAYTELAAAYPVAGGGQYFVMRGLGDLLGFMAGWAVLLDFTIDIALFAWGCVGYLSNLIPHDRADRPSAAALHRDLGADRRPRDTSTCAAFAKARLSRASSAPPTSISETSILFFGFLFAFDPGCSCTRCTPAGPTRST